MNQQGPIIYLAYECGDISKTDMFLITYLARWIWNEAKTRPEAEKVVVDLYRYRFIFFRIKLGRIIKDVRELLSFDRFEDFEIEFRRDFVRQLEKWPGIFRYWQ